MVSGINHLTLSVRDLERSLNFYANVLSLRPLARWHKGAYLLAGNDWLCLAVDFHRRGEVATEYTHVALSVSRDNFNAAVERLTSYGSPTWQANRSPGDSFYFLDPDGHKLEIHASSWRERLKHMVSNPPKDFRLL
jgi:catechol 2,3-dioxygenase-like lactoylglutathione lyase family enzyme